MLLELDNSQLVLLNYQTQLIPQQHEAALALGNAARLVQCAALLQVPSFYTEQNPLQWGPTEPGLQALLRDARAQMLATMQFSAVEEGLGEWLRPPAKAPQGNARSLPKHLQKASAANRDTLVLAGMQVHAALLQTALDLLEEDFQVWVVTDACTASSERSRDAAFDRLAGQGVELLTTEMVAYEWLRSAEHPAFAQVQTLLNAPRS